jgi:hypothetical protein
MWTSKQLTATKAIAALCGALVLPSRSNGQTADSPLLSQPSHEVPPITLRHAAVGASGFLPPPLTNVPPAPLSATTGLAPNGESVIDQNMGRASNTLEILSFLGLSASVIIGLRFSRRIPHSVIAENFVLSKDSPPGFVDAGARRVSELFPSALERVILYSAASKATPEFPSIYIDPTRHPEILSQLRRFLGSIDADTVVSAMGRSPELSATLKPWNLIIVPRVAYPDDVPVIQLDCFSYASLVKLLKDPIDVFRDLKGMNREYALNHFEAAALVAVMSPDVLRKAIAESDRLKGSEATSGEEAYAQLHTNAKALLRLLITCSQESLDVLDNAVSSQSLDTLRARASDEEMSQLLNKRLTQRNLFDRLALPVLEWLWRNPDAERWRPTAESYATSRKVYPFFMVAKMHSNAL